jgi:hypothetical protein
MRPPAGGRQYIYWYPSINLYLGNVAKLIRRRRISLKRDNHLNPYLTQHFNPSVCPVMTVEGMDVEPIPKNPTLKIPPSPLAHHARGGNLGRVGFDTRSFFPWYGTLNLLKWLTHRVRGPVGGNPPSKMRMGFYARPRIQSCKNSASGNGRIA